MNDNDTLLRDRLADAATFEVAADPTHVHEGVARRRRRIRRRRRGAVAVCALAVVALGGAGVALTVDRDSQANFTVGAVDAPPEVPDNSEAPTSFQVPNTSRSPQFLPAAGWSTVHDETSATTSNIPLGPMTLEGNVPWDTVDRLEAGDLVLFATAIPAGEKPVVDAAFPPGNLPLSIDDAILSGLEGKPDDVYDEALQVQVNGWNITVHVFYGGAAEPTPESRAAAQEQLARLDVPSR